MGLRPGQCIPGNHNRSAATAKTGIINSRPTTTTTTGSGNKSERPTHILNDDNQLNFRQKATAAKKTEHTHTIQTNPPSLVSANGVSVPECVCFLSHSLVPPPPDTHHDLPVSFLPNSSRIFRRRIAFHVPTVLHISYLEFDAPRRGIESVCLRQRHPSNHPLAASRQPPRPPRIHLLFTYLSTP